MGKKKSKIRVLLYSIHTKKLINLKVRKILNTLKYYFLVENRPRPVARSENLGGGHVILGWDNVQPWLR